jgi:DNA-binding response OmpR family regulator
MTPVPATLLIIQGEGEGQHCTINVSPFLIGRAPECHLSLSAAGVSRLHARIDYAFQQYTLSDLDSTNGTFVNDEQITGAVELHHGDRIRLASSVVLLFEDPAATAQIDVRQLRSGVHIDAMRKEVWVNGHLLDPPLSPGQYKLLELLICREGKLVTREDIAAAVWPGQTDITDEMIDALISRLRKRLAEYDADHYVVTRRGFGLIYTRE